MLEIYLITRLTALNGFFFAIAMLTGIIAIICVIVYGVNYMDDCYGDRDKLQIALKKWVRNCTITCIASTLFNIFTPTTKDAMIIYGIGTTVDFLQENENIQQLPDKCVKALNDWVDSLVENDVKQ